MREPTRMQEAAIHELAFRYQSVGVERLHPEGMTLRLELFDRDGQVVERLLLFADGRCTSSDVTLARALANSRDAA